MMADESVGLAPAASPTNGGDGSSAARRTADEPAADGAPRLPAQAGQGSDREGDAGDRRVAGAFVLLDDRDGADYAGDRFNLAPRDDRRGPIPEDQRKLNRDVYAVRNALKLLQERLPLQRPLLKQFVPNGFGAITADAYAEFVERTKQAARIGCTGPNVDTVLAAAAIDDIRADIVRRQGRPIAFRYLLALALWAVPAIAAMIIAISLADSGSRVSHYAYMLIGSMIGAWLSVASSRWEISFEGIPDFLDIVLEPIVRLLFVSLLAMIVYLLLELKLVDVQIGASEAAAPELKYLALGVFAGIGERALSMQILARAKEVFTIGSK